MLPGMMCDKRQWRHQVESLKAECNPIFTMLNGAETISGLAANVLAEAPPYFALAGLSMGGIVALEIWRQAPERVQRLALLDTNFRADPMERQLIRDQQIVRARQGELEILLRDELKPNYLANCHRSNTALLDEVLDMGMQMGPEVFVAQSHALRNRPDSTSTLRTIDRPTLVLCGDEDLLCPVALHREMAAGIAGAELTVVAQCGHLSTMEQPEQVTQALRTWLAA